MAPPLEKPRLAIEDHQRRGRAGRSRPEACPIDGYGQRCPVIRRQSAPSSVTWRQRVRVAADERGGNQFGGPSRSSQSNNLGARTAPERGVAEEAIRFRRLLTPKRRLREESIELGGTGRSEFALVRRWTGSRLGEPIAGVSERRTRARNGYANHDWTTSTRTRNELACYQQTASVRALPTPPLPMTYQTPATRRSSGLGRVPDDRRGACQSSTGSDLYCRPATAAIASPRSRADS